LPKQPKIGETYHFNESEKSKTLSTKKSNPKNFTAQKRAPLYCLNLKQWAQTIHREHAKNQSESSKTSTYTKKSKPSD
jgi:hypothetical protein